MVGWGIFLIILGAGSLLLPSLASAADRVTVKGLTVAKVDVENNLLMVRGAVPGANGSLVVVKKS